MSGASCMGKGVVAGMAFAAAVLVGTVVVAMFLPGTSGGRVTAVGGGEAMAVAAGRLILRKRVSPQGGIGLEVAIDVGALAEDRFCRLGERCCPVAECRGVVLVKRRFWRRGIIYVRGEADQPVTVGGRIVLAAAVADAAACRSGCQGKMCSVFALKAAGGDIAVGVVNRPVIMRTARAVTVVTGNGRCRSSG